MNNPETQKILIILMQELAEVIAEGVPFIRYLKAKQPQSEIHFLTYAEGAEIIRLAHPDVVVHGLQAAQWPDNILQAMESFLGVAEDIVGQAYSKIVNLDTWFMPCFLARFLKDAGEPIEGNFLRLTVQALIEQIQAQSLETDFVHNQDRYMDSTWFSMARWHTPWWQGGFLPDGGYPEFYLRSCCGFADLELDMTIQVRADLKINQHRNRLKVIAISLESPIKERHYPYGAELKSRLKASGYYVWDMTDSRLPVRQKLAQLRASDLLVCTPGEAIWLATASDCKTLLVSGDVDPKIYMPDYATNPAVDAVSPELLADSIFSVFDEACDD